MTTITIAIPAEHRNSIASRFWSKVARASDDECWPWQGETDRKGYGRFCIHRRKFRSARVAYFLATNQQPGEEVMHTCDNPPCCNPAHLLPGTNLENVRDREAKGRGVRVIQVSHYGQANRNAKLTPVDIPRIRQMRKDGLTLRQIAAHFAVSYLAIYKIDKGITWGHVQ